MVKAKKNKNKNNAAAAAAAEARPSSSNLTPSKKIKKERKVNGNKNKKEGSSDAVTVAPPASAAATAAPADNNKKSEQKADKSNTALANNNNNNNKSGEQKADKSSGFIFMCNSKTKPECYKHRVFGMPKGKAEVAQRIKPGTRLFLYDFDLKLMYGIYRATSGGGMNLVPGAFNGAFPAQVKFKIDKDCVPLPESTFKQAILENYDSKNKFQPDLNSKQVHKLIALFQPVTAAPQPAATQFVEDRRAPRTTHVPAPAFSYRSGHNPPVYLPPPEDPYRSSSHLTPSQLPPPEDPYRSRRHMAPAHLPPPEDPYLVRAPVSDSRYIPMHAPPPANDPYYSGAHYARAPPSLAQTTNPYYPHSSSYPHHQPEAPRAYYAENPIPSERLDYRLPSEMIARDPNAVLVRDYHTLLRRERDVAPRADHLEEPYRTEHAAPSLTYERPPVSSYRNQHYNSLVFAPPAQSVPFSSLYSLAGGAGAAPAYR